MTITDRIINAGIDATLDDDPTLDRILADIARTTAVPREVENRLRHSAGLEPVRDDNAASCMPADHGGYIDEAELASVREELDGERWDGQS